MDVMEEGFTGPVAYQHDGENWHPGQVHCHGGTRSYQMGADIASRVAQFGLPKERDGSTDLVKEHFGGNLDHHAILQMCGVDWGVRSSAFVREDMADDGSPGFYWA